MIARIRFTCLPLIFILFSCHPGTNKKQDIPAERPTERREESMLPDTAMRALKMAAKISVQDLLCQHWEMEDADRRHWNDLFWDSVADRRKFPSVNLYSDKEFTKNERCGLQMGTWDLNPRVGILQLHFADGTRERYSIRQVSLKMIETVMEKQGDSVQMRLKSDGLIHKREIEDPFFPSNNRWRIKPRAPESPSQIRGRLKACVHFYALFFKDNVERHSTDISFIGLPSCFMWYKGGIGLQPMIELERGWVDCFYSLDQAQNAYGMMNDLLQQHNLKWPKKAASWVEETQVVLEQLEQQL
jgi:hypothetical protein